MKQTPSTKEVQVSAEGMIPIGQLREFIKGTLKYKYDVVTKSSLAYAKPYTARIDSLKMPVGYQPPNFNNLMAKVTENNMSHTLSRHVIMLELTVTILSNNLFIT